MEWGTNNGGCTGTRYQGVWIELRDTSEKQVALEYGEPEKEAALTSFHFLFVFEHARKGVDFDAHQAQNARRQT